MLDDFTFDPALERGLIQATLLTCETDNWSA